MGVGIKEGDEHEYFGEDEDAVVGPEDEFG